MRPIIASLSLMPPLSGCLAEPDVNPRDLAALAPRAFVAEQAPLAVGLEGLVDDCGKGQLEAGDLCFEPVTTVMTAPTVLTAIAVGRLDRHHVDFAVYGRSNNRIHIGLGDGDGRFSSGRSLPAGPLGTLDLRIDDLDDDHLGDVATVNYSSDLVRIYWGATKWTRVTQLAVGHLPNRLLTRDLDHDGRTDLVTLGVETITRRLAPWGQAGASAVDYPSVGGWLLALADCDNDDDLDLLHLMQSPDDERLLDKADALDKADSLDGFGSLAARRNDGQGGFDEPIVTALGLTTLSEPGWPNGVAVGDFDEDGRVDVILRLDGPLLLEYLGEGECRFAPPIAVAGPVGRVVQSGDLDRDGHLDVVAGGGLAQPLTILLGHGDGSFAAHTLPVKLDRFVVADVDADSAADVLGIRHDRVVLLRQAP